MIVSIYGDKKADPDHKVFITKWLGELEFYWFKRAKSFLNMNLTREGGGAQIVVWILW